MSSSENTPGAEVSNGRAPGFHPLNPALVTALVTLVVMSLISSGWTVRALLPVYEGGPLFVSAYGDDAQMLLGVPAGVLFLACLRVCWSTTLAPDRCIDRLIRRYDCDHLLACGCAFGSRYGSLDAGRRNRCCWPN